MIVSYPFIVDLFQAIFDKSIIIDGRFHVCPKWASELNNINIDEAIPNALPKAQKYPCVLLMPPVRRGNYQYIDQQTKESEEIAMLFLSPAYYTGQNAVANYTPPPPADPDTPNPARLHTIMETWHDMARCAKDFLRVLDQVIRNAGYQNTIFISEKGSQDMIPVTEMGNDKASGIMLRFHLGASITCEIEDYAGTYIADIVVPPLTDGHPLHKDI